MAGMTHDQTPGQDNNLPPSRTPEGWRIEPGKTGTHQAEPSVSERPAGQGTAAGSPVPGAGPGELSTSYADMGPAGSNVGPPPGSEAHDGDQGEDEARMDTGY